MTESIAVIGSSNVDMIMKMPALPERGETITADTFLQTFGGKGANAAVAAARAGVETLFVNAVGNDPYAEVMVENFRADGIDCSHIYRFDDVPSGHALVMIDRGGMNYLSVAPGANRKITPELLRKIPIANYPIWMVQNEIPQETIRYVLNEAKGENNRVLWNFAPAIEMNDPPLRPCDILVLNESEAFRLSGQRVTEVDSARAAAKTLRSRGANDVVVTLGENGLIYEGGTGALTVPAFAVEVEDTTAAGDCFCGALACALAEGRDWPDALRFASAASAITVTRLGAQPSIPKRDAIDAFLRDNS